MSTDLVYHPRRKTLVSEMYVRDGVVSLVPLLTGSREYCGRFTVIIVMQPPAD